MTTVLPRTAPFERHEASEAYASTQDATQDVVRTGRVARAVALVTTVVAVGPAAVSLTLALGEPVAGGWTSSEFWAPYATIVGAVLAYLVVRPFSRGESPKPALMLGLVAFTGALVPTFAWASDPVPSGTLAVRLLLGVGAGLILAGGLDVLGGRFLLVVLAIGAPVGVLVGRFVVDDAAPRGAILAVVAAGAVLVVAAGLTPLGTELEPDPQESRRSIPGRLLALVAGAAAYGLVVHRPGSWIVLAALGAGLAVVLPLLFHLVRRDAGLVAAALVGGGAGAVLTGLVESRWDTRLGVPVLLAGILFALVMKERTLRFKRRSAPEVTLPAQQEAEPVLEEEPRFQGIDDSAPEERAVEETTPEEPSEPDEPPEPEASAEEPAPEEPEELDGTVVSVRQSDGTRVDGAVVTLTDHNGRQVARGTALDDGRHRVEVPDQGSYVLIVSAHGFNPYASVQEFGTEPTAIEVELVGESGMVGTVRRVHGDPIEGATVTLTNPRGDVVVAQLTGVDGTYAFGELVAGSYTMTVTAHAYRPAALIVHIPETGTIRQDVELVGGANLHGTVRSQNGRRPMPDARVSLIDANGRVIGVVPADSEGRYSFSDIPEGEYTVVATAHPPAASGVRIVGGADSEHDLELSFPD